jgi:hypothetical protein
VWCSEKCLSKSEKNGGKNMQANNILRDRKDTERVIDFRVVPIIRGGFGVYADAVLIVFHEDQAEAEAHCLRLRLQQTQES